MEANPLSDPQAWAQETFGTAQLGHRGRTKRLVQVAASMAADPQGSLPRQMGGHWGDLKAAYRLLRADGVSHEAISRPVWQQTRQQVEHESGVTLLVHDDTQVDYGYRPAISGLGPIGNGSHRGFLVHTVLALAPRGSSERVLGVLQQEAWVRESAARTADGRKQSSRQRQGRPRESEVWTRAVEQVGSPPQGEVWIHVGDRYADMFAFLQRCRQLGTFFLVRAAQNRRVQAWPEEAEPAVDHLLERASCWPAQGDGSIDVPSEHERRARTAQVQLSWGGMQLLPPEQGPYAGSAPLPVWVVRVWEPQPPSKQEAQRAFVPNQKHGPKRRRQAPSEEVEALEWILLSAWPVENEEQAWQAVARYCSRWPIEEFHRGMKTGCRLEQRHLREQSSVENLLAIVSPIAARLLQLRNLGREEPSQPALRWVEPEEAQVIACQQGMAVEQLTIEQFVVSVAQLGGFLRRASDGPPGWQTLWEGWLRLRWYVAGMRFAAHAHLNTSARSPCTNG
jgi:hypothetical protein